MDLGSKIKELRLERKMLQKELALYLKVSTGTVCNYEKNTHFPDGDTLCRIADLFGVSIDYLMGRTSFRYGLEILRQEISDGYPIAELINDIVSLDIQNQQEIRQFTEYRKSLSTQLSGRNTDSE